MRKGSFSCNTSIGIRVKFVTKTLKYKQISKLCGSISEHGTPIDDIKDAIETPATTYL